MSNDAELKQLARLIGAWTTEATHPALPGVVVHGVAEFEWLEGERFLIQRARVDHPDFPDAISIIGVMDQDRVDHTASVAAAPLKMHYFDSRGVFRELAVNVDATTLRFERLAQGFSQRFTGTFTDDNTLAGLWTLSRDDTHWDDDLVITYRRRL